MPPKFQPAMTITLILQEVLMVTMAGTLATVAPSLVTFIFGDSLTEVGNNNYLRFSLARSDFPFYGIDYTNRKPTGRFSNGRTISDIISEKLGVSSPPPYLSLNHDDDVILKGVNYASGGAGILNDTGIYFIQRISMDDQLGYFENTTMAIKKKIGEQPANSLLHEAIYFIAIGSNDYINNYLQPFLPASRYTHPEFLGILNLKLAQQLTRLYLLGARKMIVHGLGPLGCIPSQRAKSTTNQCLNLFEGTNGQINCALVYLKYPPRGVGGGEYFGGGFKVSNTSCCKVETVVGGLCLSYAHVCANRSEYVFWDAFHPSDAANVVLADRFFSKLMGTSNFLTKSSSNHME
ncbi:hypothetical protein E3N88_01642 [Mikania micrantha]|uniref:SGNH hydrolase-type esterase domain-containing protein n=1 Tax=Mikania micrantha TaxID=192012 RepID=A0A5N6Q349_9ASTR|nr:hypothetical protein E3N88_01642 [Mikania micrantha]